MTHYAITRVRLSPDEEWGRVCGRLEELVAAAAELGTLDEIRLVRTDARSGVLITGCADDEKLQKLSESLIGPWFDGRSLAQPGSTVRGEDIFSFSRQGLEASTFDSLGDSERVGYFVRRIVDRGTVWGLHGETWARSTAAGDREALPFWPERELAARCVEGTWSSFVPRSIELDVFEQDWLAAMQEDGIVAVVLPTPAHDGAIVTAVDLAASVREAVGDGR